MAVAALTLGGCDDGVSHSSHYPSSPSYTVPDSPDTNTGTDSYDTGEDPGYGSDNSYDYDDTPDGRFNPTPQPGPYTPGY